MKSVDVFTPTQRPTVTYVERDDRLLEKKLRALLATPGQIISLSGPSKAGKTVLVERTVGEDDLVVITGAGLSSTAELWDRVLVWIDVPEVRTRGREVAISGGVEVEASGQIGVPFVAKGGAKVAFDGSRSRSIHDGEQRSREGMEQVIRELKGEYVVLVDDFHYVPREVQGALANEMKEAARRGLKMIVASVPHRVSDVVRANPDLKGRVASIDVPYWQRSDLTKIALQGFAELAMDVDSETIDFLATEAAGSPQLMQQLCLNACFAREIYDSAEPVLLAAFNAAERQRVCQQTVSHYDFRQEFAALQAGPKTRGTERKEFAFADGTSGDVYRCVLKAIAQDPPKLSFRYDDLLRRIERLCRGGVVPQGGNVQNACGHMARIAGTFSDQRLLDWDASNGVGVLDIPEPYFLFYLRWTQELQR